VLVIACLALGVGACSSGDEGGDDGGIVDPGGPPEGTPPLPTIDDPGQALPATSAALVADTGPTAEFVPDVAAAGGFLATMNDASLCLEFRLVPGPCCLVSAGQLCPPNTMQWRLKTAPDWYDLVLDSREPCFEPLLEFGGSHYYISRHQTTWIVADVNCRLAGGDLATITDLTEHNAVFGAIAARNPDAWAFIGMFDWLQGNNNWKWRSTGLPATWAYWYPNEPNNAGGGEYFAHFHAYNHDGHGRLNDTTGLVPMYYVLERDTSFDEDDNATVPVLLAAEQPLYLRGIGCVAEKPRVERRIYWSKVFQDVVDPGESFAETHSYTAGTDTQTIRALGGVLGVSQAGGWETVAAALSTALESTLGHDVDLGDEIIVRRDVDESAGEGETLVLALWQLRERYVLCNANGQPWSDPAYTLATELPVLDHGLDEDYLQIISFAQP
jgi:hypothetical protein